MSKYSGTKEAYIRNNLIKEDGIFLKGHDTTNKWFWKPIFIGITENMLYGSYVQFSQDFSFKPQEVKSMKITCKGKKVFIHFEVSNEFVRDFNNIRYPVLRLKFGKFPAEKVLETLTIFQNKIPSQNQKL